MKKILFPILLFGVTLFSCEGPVGTYKSVTTSPDFPLRLQLTQGGTTSFSQLYTSRDNTDNLLASYYNRFKHRIEYYDVISGKYIRSIPLEKEGPNGVPVMRSHFPIDNDKIFCDGSNYLLVVDAQGNVQTKRKSFVANSDSIHYSFTGARISGTTSYGSSAYCNIKKREAVFEIMQAINLAEYQKDSLTLGVLSVNGDLPLKELITVPKPANHTEYLGLVIFTPLINPEVCHAGNKLIYNYPYDSRFYVYDREEETTTMYNPGTAFGKPQFEPVPRRVDYDQLRIIRDRNPLFGQLIPNPYRKEYYRFYKTEKKESKDTSADLCLQIFDEKFNLKADVNLKQSCWARPLFLGEEVYLRANPDDVPDEDHVYFRQLIFE